MGSATVKQARRQASRYRGLTTCAVTKGTHTRGGGDLDGGLRLHLSSSQ
jgi:hypothetical protein